MARQIRSRDGAPVLTASLANKLLVMIDGRAVYTPLFGGVFWDVQNVQLSDIARIEVVSGPGGTLWGSNAVNGVINVVSQSAAETQGWRIAAAVGDFVEHTAAVRYGGKLGDDLHYRVYARQFGRGSTQLSGGIQAKDEWQLSQGGFRLDFAPSDENALTVQGDVYDGAEGSPTSVEVGGNNILARWARTVSATSDFELQAYYDRTARLLPAAAFSVKVETFDLDFHHHLSLGNRVDLVWGAGYRAMQDDVQNSAALSFDPAARDMNLVSAFVQSDISIVPDRLRLTLGSKLEHNDFSDVERQPRVQMSWTPSDTQTLWGAVSRAVRSPSRFDSDEITPFIATPGEFFAETLVAYELGYRWRSNSVALSATAFWHDYDELRALV